jgi:hypothetical protein
MQAAVAVLGTCDITAPTPPTRTMTPLRSSASLLGRCSASVMTQHMHLAQEYTSPGASYLPRRKACGAMVNTVPVPTPEL